MSPQTSERIGMLARAYWQPLVLAVLILVIVGQLFSWGATVVEFAKVDRMIEEAENVDSPATESNEPENPRQGPSGPRADSNRSNQTARNIFKNEKQSYTLTMIYMDTAVINGQNLKVGDRVGKAVVQSIDLTSVELLEDGSESPKTIAMFQGSGDSPGGGRRGGGPPSGMRHSGTQRSGNRSPALAVSSGGNQGGGDMFERIRNMSREERRSYFQNLSESEREELRQRARERFGGRGPGGGGPVIMEVRRGR